MINVSSVTSRRIVLICGKVIAISKVALVRLFNYGTPITQAPLRHLITIKTLKLCTQTLSVNLKTFFKRMLLLLINIFALVIA